MAAVEAVKNAINFLTDPRIFLPLAAVLFFLAINRRGVWTKKTALILFPLGALFVAVSMLDPDFAKIVQKPDNVPIVAMLFLVGFFTWLAMHQAHQNDDRIARGEPP